MNTAYVGDITDFAKYGLLRRLSGTEPPSAPRIKLGVIWYQREQPTFAAVAKGSYRDVSLEAVDPTLSKTLQTMLGRRPTLDDVRTLHLIGDASAVEFYDRPIAR